MPSGRQICSASASLSQRASSASSAARRFPIARSARSTVRQSGLAAGRCAGAHVGAGSISTVACSVSSRSMTSLLRYCVSLSSTGVFGAMVCALRDDSCQSAKNVNLVRIPSHSARRRVTAKIYARFSVSCAEVVMNRSSGFAVVPFIATLARSGDIGRRRHVLGAAVLCRARREQERSLDQPQLGATGRQQRFEHALDPPAEVRASRPHCSMRLAHHNMGWAWRSCWRAQWT